MHNVIITTPILPPPNTQEIYRYAGGKGEIDAQTASLIQACLNECEDAGAMQPSVCYVCLPARQAIDAFACGSTLVQRKLDGCDKAVVFAATVGLGIDRLIKKYAQVSPAKALLMQAIGAERIESLCDAFCREIQQEQACGEKATARFSPGYGDFPLQAQVPMHAALQCYKYIGVTLNDSLLMTPTKSVTAIFGLKNSQETQTSGCSTCNKQDCQFRK